MDNELAWAVGLFEGEGCISLLKGKKRVTLRVASTDLDVLQRFHSIVGCGQIHTRKKRMDHWKQSYEWQAGKRQDVLRMLKQMLPWLGERRAYIALNAFDYCEL